MRLGRPWRGEGVAAEGGGRRGGGEAGDAMPAGEGRGRTMGRHGHCTQLLICQGSVVLTMET